MPLYKILELDERGWDGWVRAPHETWPTLADALDELGPEGWEMRTTIYAPADGHLATQVPRATVMAHPGLSRKDDLDRIRRKVEKRLSEARDRLQAQALAETERFNADLVVREATTALEALLQIAEENRLP